MNFQAQWRDLRIRQAILATCFAAVILVALAVSPFAHCDSVILVAEIPVVIAIFAAGVWHHRFRCPSCGELFFRRAYYQNPFTSKCLHCGCKLGA